MKIRFFIVINSTNLHYSHWILKTFKFSNFFFFTQKLNLAQWLLLSGNTEMMTIG